MNFEVKNASRIPSGLSWLVTLLIPLVIVMAAVRIVLTSWFLEFEYRTPNFPDDPLYFFLPAELEPFSFEERIHNAEIARQYLLNDADISFLGDLRFREGQQAPPASCQYMDNCTRLYNDRELEHMVDVKIVTQAALRLWHFSIAVLLALSVWAWFGGWLPTFRRSLRRGGWLTIIMIAIVIALVLLAFGFFFTLFHDVFFAPGTWMFLSSDTLIRLFPERFWRDTFIVVGLLSVGMSLLLVWLAPKLGKNSQ
jgi:integral membrane protein (TIGR01906 family)